MKIYRILENGYFGGEETVDDDTFGIPLGMTRTEPPEIPPGYYAYWYGTQWGLVQTAPPIIDGSTESSVATDDMINGPSADPVLPPIIEPGSLNIMDPVDAIPETTEIATNTDPEPTVDPESTSPGI